MCSVSRPILGTKNPSTLAGTFGELDGLILGRLAPPSIGHDRSPGKKGIDIMVTWSIPEPPVPPAGHDHTDALDLLIIVLDGLCCPVIREPLRIIKEHIEQGIPAEPAQRRAA